MKPWKIIQELESDNSRLKKEAIIRRESDAENIEFFNGVGMALDGFRTFVIQKVPTSKIDGPGLNWERFAYVVNKLEKRAFLKPKITVLKQPNQKVRNLKFEQKQIKK